MLLRMAGFHSFLRLNIIPLCVHVGRRGRGTEREGRRETGRGRVTPPRTHPSADTRAATRVGCCTQFFNGHTGARPTLRIGVFASFGETDHTAVPALRFCGSSVLPSAHRGRARSHSCTNRARGSPLALALLPVPAGSCSLLPPDGHSDRREVVSRRGSDGMSPMTVTLSIFPCACWPSVCPLWQTSIRIGPLSNRIAFLLLSCRARVFWI